MLSGDTVFQYSGQDRSEVPDDTTLAIVPSSSLLKLPHQPAKLASGAFVECPNLQTVVLPEGLKQIGQNAFYNCPVLTTVHFPTTLEEIHDNAFSLCFHLTNLLWPCSLISIGENAFFECSKLKSLDLSACINLQVISDCAFQRCIRVAHAELPKEGRLVTIEKQAFSSCTSLQQIIIPDTVDFIGDQAFADCSCLANLQLSQSLKAIKEATFCGCDSLIQVTIPPGITIIEMDAFAHCERLERVKFLQGTSITTIGDSAFVSCHSLRRLCAPSNLKLIGDFCFANCSSLVSVELPRCLEQVGEDAFSNCTALRNIYFCHSVRFEGPCLNNCTLLEEKCQDQLNRLLFGDRFDGLPFHLMAYRAIFEEDSAEHLCAAENHTCATDLDMLGMTPFHILALSENPNQKTFEYLLQQLPGSSADLCRKDCFGFTPLELLCSHSNFEDSKAKVLLNHCIEHATMERIRWLGLASWRMALFFCIDDLFGAQEPSRPLRIDNELGQEQSTSPNTLIRIHKLHFLFNELSKYELLEATSLLELSLWKMQLTLTAFNGNQESSNGDRSLQSPSLRLASRINCKADIVLPNILPYLIE